MQVSRLTRPERWCTMQPFTASHKAVKQANRTARIKAQPDTAVSGGQSAGAESLEQRQQEAREWVAAWRNNGAASSSAAESNGAAPKPKEAAHKGSQGSQNGSSGKYSPDEIYDDGTMLFSSSSLLAVDFEDVLSP